MSRRIPRIVTGPAYFQTLRNRLHPDRRRSPPYEVLLPGAEWNSFGTPMHSKPHLKLKGAT